MPALLATGLVAPNSATRTCWQSAVEKNILLSVVFEMESLKLANAFEFNMLVAITTRTFFQKYVEEKVTIKWPNDIIVNGAKIAGILVDNKICKQKEVQ